MSKPTESGITADAAAAAAVAVGTFAERDERGKNLWTLMTLPETSLPSIARAFNNASW